MCKYLYLDLNVKGEIFEDKFLINILNKLYCCIISTSCID